MRNLVGSWKVYLGKTAIILLTVALFVSVASCKHKPTESKKPILTSLTIDGKAVEIKDEMNGGTTTNRRVKVAYTYEPSDATVECNPILNTESKWEFQDFGENILKITVKKGTEEKLYTFKITKESSEVIQSLQIGQDIKRPVDKDDVVAGIENEMEFAVPFNATSVDIDLKLKEGAVATWKVVTPGAPEVKENKITFGTGNDLELSRPVYKLTVTDKNGEVSEYTVKVIKMVAYIFMNKEANVSSDTKYTFNKDLNKIINHDETFELQIEEPKLDLKWYSPTIKWKSFVVHVDGKDLPSVVTDPAVKDFAVGKMIIPFNKGETKEIIVKIENNEVQVEEEEGVKTVTPLTGNLARETFKFKVTRLDKRIDLPTSYLKLSGKDIVKNNPEMLAKLHSNTNFPDCIASDPCTVKIGLNKKLTKITINDQDITSQTINPNGTKKEYSSPELEITGFKNAPKVVTIVATPEDTETYRETTWKLKLHYLEASPISVDYEINGVADEDLPFQFQEAVAEGWNPLINVHAKVLNVKITSKKELETVMIGSTSVPVKTVAGAPGLFGPGPSTYVALHTETLTAGTEKDIVIKVTAKSKDYSPKEIKFKVKGDDTKEKMSPILQEIAGDKELPVDLISNLTQTEEANLKSYTILRKCY